MQQGDNIMQIQKKHPQLVYEENTPVAVIIEINEYREMLDRLEDKEDLEMINTMKKKDLQFRKLDDFLSEYVPDDVIKNFTIKKIRQSFLEDFVASEYEKGKISLRQGAEILNMHYTEFMDFLGEQKIPICNASKEELEESRQVLENYFQQKAAW